MAPLWNYFIFFLFLSLLHQGVTSSESHHPGIKSLSFTLYQHETINKTGFIIVSGMAGEPVNLTTAPIGTVSVFNDPMKTGFNASSRIVGVAEGVSTSLDALRGITYAKVTLKWKGYQGSLSILGGTHNTQVTTTPVVGGTDDFMFIQGYVRTSLVGIKGLTVIYKADFHLFWPPYATHKIS